MDLGIFILGLRIRSVVVQSSSVFADSPIVPVLKPTYVTAELKVKNRFMLGMPSTCPESLAMMFQDQLVTLNEIVKSEQDQEDKVHLTFYPITRLSELHQEYYTKEWLSPSAPGKAGDIIMITSPAIYRVCPSQFFDSFSSSF